MPFADPRAAATAYLILRHLYDGDIIDWPSPDDHPLREVFAQLEAQGYVARWDRVWPLHDRYRLLTEKGTLASRRRGKVALRRSSALRGRRACRHGLQ